MSAVTESVPVKVEPEAVPVKTETEDEDLLQKIAERLAFFFSVANLRTDKFMKHEIQSRPTMDIEIEKLLRFKTIKALTTSSEDISKAAESFCQDLLTVNGDRDALSRKDIESFEFKPDIEKIHSLTVFVDGLPVDENKKFSVGIPDIISLFESFGKVTLVRLRFDKLDKTAQGSGFIEFESRDIVKSVLEHEKPLELKGNTLSLKSMNAWIEEKEGRKSKNGNKKRSRDDDYNGAGNLNSNNDAEAEAKAKADAVTIDWKKGCVVSLKGLSDGCDRESILASIKEKCEEYEMDSKPYVDYSRGQTNGAIRFKQPFEKIRDFVSDLKNGDIKILDQKVEDASVLAGEEEEQYWKAFLEFKRKQTYQFALQRNGNKKRKGGRGGGRGGGRFRRGGRR